MHWRALGIGVRAGGELERRWNDIRRRWLVYPANLMRRKSDILCTKSVVHILHKILDQITGF
jgi:hypothetical protein